MGYFAVSIAVGLAWAQNQLPPISGAIFSATNLSSTGQFADLSIMAAHGGFAELALTTVLVNLRYLLMGTSLSQLLTATNARPVGTLKRLIISYGITDEIYAVNISRPRITFAHYFGSTLLPILGWTAGTLVGAIGGGVLPESLRSASGVLLYAMFIAIVVPPFKASRQVKIVSAIAAALSFGMWAAPVLSELSSGWRIIIATVLAAGIGATAFPREEHAAPASVEGAAQ